MSATAIKNNNNSKTKGWCCLSLNCKVPFPTRPLHFIIRQAEFMVLSLLFFFFFTSYYLIRWDERDASGLHRWKHCYIMFILFQVTNMFAKNFVYYSFLCVFAFYIRHHQFAMADGKWTTKTEIPSSSPVICISPPPPLRLTEMACCTAR